MFYFTISVWEHFVITTVFSQISTLCFPWFTHKYGGMKCPLRVKIFCLSYSAFIVRVRHGVFLIKWDRNLSCCFCQCSTFIIHHTFPSKYPQYGMHGEWHGFCELKFSTSLTLPFLIAYHISGEVEINIPIPYPWRWGRWCFLSVEVWLCSTFVHTVSCYKGRHCTEHQCLSDKYFAWICHPCHVHWKSFTHFSFITMYNVYNWISQWLETC